MTVLQDLLAQTAALHKHLCPRQVLGVRMGLYAGALLALHLPQTDKRVFAIIETDGCFADGLSAATGCWLGRRTMRLFDYGKVAATLIDTRNDRAIRIAPHPLSRQRALLAVPDADDRWHAQLRAYQIMADEDLFEAVPVQLTIDLHALISRPGLRATCDTCGEEILNAREVQVGTRILCLGCASGAYFSSSEMVSIGTRREDPV